MDKGEALDVLKKHLMQYRGRSHRELQALLKEPDVLVVTGPSGTEYQIEIQAVWDGRRGGNVRVFGTIDDGGWRAFLPLATDFMMAPDGTSIGE